jgi:hypothetical protein
VLDGEINSLAPVSCLGANGEVRPGLQQRTQTASNNEMIISNQNPHHHGRPR